MRVLHLGRFLDEKFGGLERFVVELLDELSKFIQVENLVTSRKNRWRSTVENRGRWIAYQTASLGVVASTAISPVFVLRLWNLCRKNKYDIVHLHFPDPLSCISALLLPRSTRIVISWHSDVIKQRAFLALYQPFVNMLLRRVRAVVAATPGHFRDSTQLHVVPESKKHIVPYGIDVESFAYSEATQAKANAQRSKLGASFVIFAVGRHVYYKGFDHLIAALAQFPEATLVLAGDGPLTSDLKAFARQLGIADRIHFPGRVSEEDLRMYYHLCDVFCLSSIEKSEAFGLVQGEAMACGKPVVCYDLDNGVTYVNRHMETGLVVPLGSVEGLAQALRKMYLDPALASQLGKQALERIQSEFSLQAMGEKMLRLYRDILDAG